MQIGRITIFLSSVIKRLVSWPYRHRGYYYVSRSVRSFNWFRQEKQYF